MIGLTLSLLVNTSVFLVWVAEDTGKARKPAVVYPSLHIIAFPRCRNRHKHTTHTHNIGIIVIALLKLIAAIRTAKEPMKTRQSHGAHNSALNPRLLDPKPQTYLLKTSRRGP